jgi:uncharacterized membrane protein YqjE
VFRAVLSIALLFLVSVVQLLAWAGEVRNRWVTIGITMAYVVAFCTQFGIVH